MPDKTPVTLNLFRTEGMIPPPDDLIAGSKGAVYTDIVKVSVAGEFKRGTLMMTGTDGYIPSTQAGLATANGICILSETITVSENEYAETPVYFEGEFNDARIIFPFEGENDNHEELVESVRDVLRKAKIFLRHINP